MFRNGLQVSAFVIVVIWLLAAPPDSHADAPLKIITSADPDSNAVQSFIYIPNGMTIPQGIKQGKTYPPLRLQIPFVIDLPVALTPDLYIQWQVETERDSYGEIRVLSKYAMTTEKLAAGQRWTSSLLDHSAAERERLVFRPAPLKHEPAIYKKGRGKQGKRRKYGGGTLNIDDTVFNPRLTYSIKATVTAANGEQQVFRGNISMDNKDLIRQEYINHFGINRYGRGENGNLPVPTRAEISAIPSMPEHMLGNGFSESEYGLMVNDGISPIATAIVGIYEAEKKRLSQQKGEFVDLNNQPLAIPDSKLWLSGGWRNPERNEWYSNATNGIHQRGGAIDVVAYESHSDKKAAIVYWFLWQALNRVKTLDAFWQLETHGRPMTTREFKEDIEPANGIPDAFDKADHMHININYP